MALPSKPITRKEKYLNAAVTGSISDMPDKPITREEEYLQAIANGSGGTTDYTALENKPKINSETLTGDFEIGFTVSDGKATFKTGGKN